MADLKPRHTVEELNRFIEVVRRHNSPLPWENDIERANKKIGELYQALIWARNGLIAYMEMTHLYHDDKSAIIEFSAMALKGAEAEQPTVTFESPGPCGYYPNSKSDPRD